MIRLFLQPRGFLRRCLRLNPKILFAVSVGVILADASAEIMVLSPRPTEAVNFAGESGRENGKTTRDFSNRQLLSKFAMIESSNRPLTIGDGGAARGAHQLHLAAVLDCGGTHADFIALTNRAVSDKFAGAYLNLIKTKLAKAGIKNASPAQIYMVWNGGFTNAKRRGFNPANAPKITRNAIAKL